MKCYITCNSYFCACFAECPIPSPNSMTNDLFRRARPVIMT